MIRIILSSAIALHGVIHLMGFAKEWNLGPDGKFSGKTIFHLSENASKLAGIFWLLTCILLLASTYAYYLRKDWFWVIAIAGLVLSQALIIVYWPEAKWGTVVNVALMFTVVFAAGRITFDSMVEKDIANLVSSSSTNGAIVSEEKVSVLPNIIQQWLQKSNVIGKPIPASVHIRQQGTMSNDRNSEWMPFDAEQCFTIDPPAFVWKATIHTDKFIDIVGRDKYEHGKGNMLIKAASLIPIANSSGKEVDQGTMIRYMAEMIWFPQAAAANYLTWEQVGEDKARVTMRYGGITASGIYHFNEKGFPVAFEAQRWGDFNGKYSLERWSVSITGYREFEGIQIGATSEVTWKLKDGDFTWLRLSITDINYQ